MAETRFPNGIDVGSEAGAAGTFKIGGTAVSNPLGAASAGQRVTAGTITVPTGASGTAVVSGLTTVAYAVSSLIGVAGAGCASTATSWSGGTVTVLGISGAGTISTAAGTAAWFAIGT